MTAVMTAYAARIVRHRKGDFSIPTRDRTKYESPDVTYPLNTEPTFLNEYGWPGESVPESDAIEVLHYHGYPDWILEPPVKFEGKRELATAPLVRVRRFKTMPTPCIVLGRTYREEGSRNTGQVDGEGWLNCQRRIPLTVVALFSHPWLALVWIDDLTLGDPT